MKNKSKVENGEVIERFRKQFKGKIDKYLPGLKVDNSKLVESIEWELEAFITNALNQEHDKAYEEGARNQALLDADALNQQREV